MEVWGEFFLFSLSSGAGQTERATFSFQGSVGECNCVYHTFPRSLPCCRRCRRRRRRQCVVVVLLSLNFNQRTKQLRIKQESSKNQARIKTQESRLKNQESSKIKTQESSKNQARLGEGLLSSCLFVRLFVRLFVCFCQNHIMKESDLFKQALEGGSSLILLSSQFG